MHEVVISVLGEECLKTPPLNAPVNPYWFKERKIYRIQRHLNHKNTYINPIEYDIDVTVTNVFETEVGGAVTFGIFVSGITPTYGLPPLDAIAIMFDTDKSCCTMQCFDYTNCYSWR